MHAGRHAETFQQVTDLAAAPAFVVDDPDRLTVGAVVHAQSPSCSVIAPWNSSSRGPVGLVKKESTRPNAAAARDRRHLVRS